MGAFYDWVKGTYLEEYQNRKAADVAEHIMQGAAYLYKVQALKMQGITIPEKMKQFYPDKTSIKVEAI